MYSGNNVETVEKTRCKRVGEMKRKKLFFKMEENENVQTRKKSKKKNQKKKSKSFFIFRTNNDRLELLSS